MTAKQLLEHLGKEELDFEIVLSTGQKFSEVKVDVTARTISIIIEEDATLETEG